ncbi:hypothetical protein B8U81_03760 [Streptococcus agalactiae]|nr:hypothetical protein B8U81_03760 [Streptococcus agalactiae]
MNTIANWILFLRAGYKRWYTLIPVLSGFTKHERT